MSNFTKSLVYSGVVLMAGLIAIFAVANNLNTQQEPGRDTAHPSCEQLYKMCKDER